ncbi:HAD-IA family hydrolase [Synechococcus sp. CS-1329]|jgi:HAD superfamily hydrolase (TIGR01509 family)|uniref:HAD-IA family hydrolase n=1 Tax=Synechococcus sp. CS-1329 TaxID=2847975 RepID=UPI00223AD772|nr:HAD-IA family hydrolase [Synechococcus sp. CS-1329]MCT0217861.1 HAD-IA family hydrolase [Synechococcus sp. CS-1329]
MQARAVQGSLRALLWDVDGTLAETELDGHRVAFNRAFAQLGLPWRWDPATYIELLAISGGRERLHWFLQHQQGGQPEEELLEALHRAKQRHYRQLLEAGEVQLRAGVRRLIQAAAAAGLQQAIVTTSGREAVAALLENQLRELSELLPLRICADDVTAKKPDPEAYLLALQRLGLEPSEAVAIEDSPAGLAAATAAGLRCLVTLSAATGQHPAAQFKAASSLTDGLEPTRVLRGPACAGGLITLSYLEQLPAMP